MKQPALPREFNEQNYGQLVDLLNTFFKEISLENMSGQVIENIDIPAGSSVKVAHSLKVTPKYRIILRQSAIDALITDGDDLWNETSVSMKNHGGADTTISLFLLRG